MKKEYASSEERAVDVLYQRLGRMTLIKDKDGKPKEWKTLYPPMKDLIANCEGEGLELPKNPKLHDVLLTMVKAGYNNIQRYPSPDQAIKSLSDRVFAKEQEDLGFPVSPGAEKNQIVDKQQTDIYKKEVEDAKLEAQRARVEADQAISEAEHAKNEAEEAKREANIARIATEKVKVQAMQVEHQVERTELEIDPEKNKTKLAKLEAEEVRLAKVWNDLEAMQADLNAATKKKSSPDNKKAKK